MIHSPALLVLLAVLATARLTRLVNEDSIFDRPRARLQRKTDGPLAYFITCPWCVSIWVAGGVAGATYAWHHYWAVQVGLLALAASYATGLLATLVLVMEE